MAESVGENTGLSERLEKISGLPISLENKIWMSLVCMDLIPAWEIQIKVANAQSVEEINSALIDIGFETERGAVIEHNPDEIYVDILYSNSSQSLNQLKELVKHPDDPDVHSKAGRLYGFPESATQAFVSREEKIEKGKLPPEIQNEDYMFLAQFALSKRNWREELETVKKWAEALRKNAPGLWEKYVQEMRIQRSQNYGER